MVHAIKKITAWIFIFSVVLLTVLAVMSIWDFMERDVMEKSLASLIYLAGSAAVVYLTTLTRSAVSLSEKGGQTGHGIGLARMVIYIILGIIALGMLKEFIFDLFYSF